MSAKILIQLKLHKKQNELFYLCVREYLLLKNSVTILKVPNNFSFHIVSPFDQNYILMITNFPDEEGFAQSVLLKNYSPAIGNDWNIIKYICFDDLIDTIEHFIKTKTFQKYELNQTRLEKNLKDFIDLVD